MYHMAKARLLCNIIPKCICGNTHRACVYACVVGYVCVKFKPYGQQFKQYNVFLHVASVGALFEQWMHVLVKWSASITGQAQWFPTVCVN